MYDKFTCALALKKSEFTRWPFKSFLSNGNLKIPTDESFLNQLLILYQL